MDYRIFAKNPTTLPIEFEEASTIARQLRDHLASDMICSAIGECHKLNGTSRQIQTILTEKLLQLGFQSERRGLFAEFPVANLRPDFYRRVRDSGILVEIERGKTLTNNIDLLDLWKCHLCAHADFLFLVVPNERASENGQVIRAFDGASRRLSTFFEPKSYVNVEAVYLFGYEQSLVSKTSLISGAGRDAPSSSEYGSLLLNRGPNYELPIRMPVMNTRTPPNPTCSTAESVGVSM